jgi:hypothetical protein
MLPAYSDLLHEDQRLGTIKTERVAMKFCQAGFFEMQPDEILSDRVFLDAILGAYLPLHF